MIATDDRPLEGFEQRLLDELLDRAAALQVTTTPDATYRDEMWLDEAHPDRFRSLVHGDDGQPALDSSSRGGVGGQPSATRTIDHAAWTWSETRTPGAATRSGVPARWPPASAACSTPSA
jgi:hypothetical protein